MTGTSPAPGRARRTDSRHDGGRPSEPGLPRCRWMGRARRAGPEPQAI